MVFLHTVPMEASRISDLCQIVSSSIEIKMLVILSGKIMINYNNYKIDDYNLITSSHWLLPPDFQIIHRNCLNYISIWR